MVMNIATGSVGRIREILAIYGPAEVGAYGDGQFFIVYEDDSLTPETQVIEKEVEVIKEVEKIVEVDNPKLLDKITSLAESLKTCQAENKILAKTNKNLESQKKQLMKTVESLSTVSTE